MAWRIFCACSVVDRMRAAKAATDREGRQAIHKQFHYLDPSDPATIEHGCARAYTRDDLSANKRRAAAARRE